MKNLNSQIFIWFTCNYIVRRENSARYIGFVQYKACGNLKLQTSNETTMTTKCINRVNPRIVHMANIEKKY